MNIYEAERLATSDGEPGQMCAQAALLNHKNDNFMKALEALKQVSKDLHAEIDCSGQIPTDLDQIDTIIKKLEAVT